MSQSNSKGGLTPQAGPSLQCHAMLSEGGGSLYIGARLFLL